MCNTDARVYALALNRGLALAQACSVAISSNHRGFIVGRRSLSSVALCDVAMGEAALRSVDAVDAAGIFLDFANACPMPSRRWLRLVLDRARIPAQFKRTVLCLYDDQKSLFDFGGEVVASVAMRCGVKQGCPLTGSLVAFCADALLHLVSAMPSQRRRVFVCADDLAIIVQRLFQEMPALLALLRRWGGCDRAALATQEVCDCVLPPLWLRRESAPRSPSPRASRWTTRPNIQESGWAHARLVCNGGQYLASWCRVPPRSLVRGWILGRRCARSASMTSRWPLQAAVRAPLAGICTGAPGRSAAIDWGPLDGGT